jgi:Na+/H+ antiporter NhaD/arsenite permease-like protein
MTRNVGRKNVMTIEQLTITCAILAFAFGLFYFAVHRLWLHLLLHFLGPLAVAMALYWFPNLDQLGNIEYRTWAPVFLLGMMAFAVPASLSAGLFSWIVRKRIGQPGSPD